MSGQYFVYIMAGHARTLYTGMINNIERRVVQHKWKAVPGFTSKYNINQLVHLESFDEVAHAIAREKQIKSWSRAKKIALIESGNPEWQDLASHLGPDHSQPVPPIDLHDDSDPD